ncbi:MAG: ABC transporter ATP-binding protein [Candidatus Tectomicrobia bacterium]|uniref:ABC transporter ATP-binding protein n=1 Tax=Tectimicrobiota bacterium TaxID=2528274 RepID=A0A932LZE1_UNCTE|nr:ABC transporter ATP-binding protein [Candidatus Tectomicrobia bacterium]
MIKRFSGEGHDLAAVNGISFAVPKGRLFTLLGPSGCGKSTTLRCIAGLEKPEGGFIAVSGQMQVNTAEKVFVPPHKRGIGMVFQSYAIWPHMTVYENVAYALEVKRVPRGQVRERVMEALDLVGLGGLEDRPAPKLSGGQQQRVALARAIVGRPNLLLFDEPLSNLDAKLRERMRHEIRELQQRLEITTVYVTHDQTEALAISDTIAVMEGGTILSMGSPREIYGEPGNRFVADFVGLTNILRGQAVSNSLPDGTGRVDVSFGKVRCRFFGEIWEGDEVDVLIRPENISVSHSAPDVVENVWQATVDQVTFLGECQDCNVKVQDQILRIRVNPALELRVGQKVYLETNPHRCSSIRTH